MTAFFRATTVLLLLLPTSFCFDGVDFVFKSISDKAPRALLSNQDGSVFSQLPASALTFCFYAYLENVHGETATLVSYSSRNEDSPNELYLEAVYQSRSYTALSIRGAKAIFPKTPDLDAWTHVCCSWSSSSGQAQLFFNGKNIVGGEAEVQKGNRIGGNGYFVWGQDQDDYDASYDQRQGVKGRMTQFNLWDRALTEEEVKETMSNNLNDGVIAWANSSWQFSDGIMVEKTTAPVYTSCGKVQKPQCKNVEHTFTSPYDLETGFEDGISNEVTGTLNNVDVPEMKEFSICFYIHDELHAYTNQPISYKNTEGEPVITFGASSTPAKLYFGVGNNNAEVVNVAISSKSILHFCETWSSTTGELTSYIGGAVFRKFKNISKDYTVPGNGELVITQEQNAPLDKESVTKGFRYKLTDLYMWDRLLTDAEVASFINCTGSVEGYLVNPSTSEWEVENHGCPPYSKVSPIESTNNRLLKPVVLLLQHVQNIEKLNKFSLCFWAYSETETPDVGIVIEVDEFKLNLENGLAFRVHDNSTHFPDYSVAAGSWQHICLTWSGVEGGKTQLFVDGEKKGSAEGIGTGKSIPEASSWRVFNQQYALPDKEDPTKGFAWKMTDLNVWNYVISEEEVKQAQQCSLVLGNVITAKSSTWTMLDS